MDPGCSHHATQALYGKRHGYDWSSQGSGRFEHDRPTRFASYLSFFFFFSFPLSLSFILMSSVSVFKSHRISFAFQRRSVASFPRSIALISQILSGPHVRSWAMTHS